MADGLLLTRRERASRFWTRFGIGFAPTVALALASIVLGANVTAAAIAAAGAAAAVAIGSNARTRAGALVGGLVVAALIFAFQLFVAWMVTHPILPGS